METEDLNHIALHVSNLEASNKFYGDLLGLEKIKRPDFDFPGEGYRLGKSQELHLIAGRADKVNSSTRGNHFALGVKNIDLTEVFLKDKGIFFTPRQTRPDGAFQIYCEDPDGYWIEFCQNRVD